MRDDIKYQQRPFVFSCLTQLLNDPLKIAFYSLAAVVSDSDNKPYGAGAASLIPVKSQTPIQLGRRVNMATD